jgi:hypothetical protein
MENPALQMILFLRAIPSVLFLARSHLLHFALSLRAAGHGHEKQGRSKERETDESSLRPSAVVYTTKGKAPG